VVLGVGETVGIDGALIKLGAAGDLSRTSIESLGAEDEVDCVAEGTEPEGIALFFI
jgi:hypothetical protein